MSLKATIKDAMKAAMRAKDKERLGTIRLIQAEFKRIEVDERVDLADDDARILAILDKAAKQRRDSITQYTDANRPELAEKEQGELEVIKSFLPQQLSTDEINTLIDAAIAESGAASMQDMGKVMGLVKPQIQGRADVAEVSKTIKNRLA
ncbi:MAG: GatB/YqeY domain-containing protein [Pseudomonadales bacterium]|nr:GatB/YqeY domain-containing protein [Pseudomonadales bacterium]